MMLLIRLTTRNLHTELISQSYPFHPPLSAPVSPAVFWSQMREIFFLHHSKRLNSIHGLPEIRHRPQRMLILGQEPGRPIGCPGTKHMNSSRLSCCECSDDGDKARIEKARSRH